MSAIHQIKVIRAFTSQPHCRSNIIWIIKRSLLTVVLVLIFLLKQTIKQTMPQTTVSINDTSVTKFRK